MMKNIIPEFGKKNVQKLGDGGISLLRYQIRLHIRTGMAQEPEVLSN